MRGARRHRRKIAQQSGGLPKRLCVNRLLLAEVRVEPSILRHADRHNLGFGTSPV
jgi:hypothetical protein